MGISGFGPQSFGLISGLNVAAYFSSRQVASSQRRPDATITVLSMVANKRFSRAYICSFK